MLKLALIANPEDSLQKFLSFFKKIKTKFSSSG